MKVLFCIWSYNKGVGGHFYSLSSIYEELIKNSTWNIDVLNLGTKESLVIKNKISSSLFIKFSIFTFFSSLYKCYYLCKKNKYNIIHCFDLFSYYCLRFSAYLLNIKIIVTYPGGPNKTGKTKYFPKIDNLICFSNENYNFFSSNYVPKKINKIWLQPNRIATSTTDNNRILLLEKKYPKNGAIMFIRVTRIGPFYKSSIIKSINLIKELREKNINCKLVVIGKVEDNEILNDLICYSKNEKVYFEIEDFFTLNASELLNYFDFVIGTGRSAMEGISAKKNVLCFVKDNMIPTLLTNSNFDIFSFYNFSMRTIYNITEYTSLMEIIHKINSISGIDSELYNTYEQNYSVNNITTKYYKIYNSAVSPTIHFTNIIDLLFLLKKMI